MNKSMFFHPSSPETGLDVHAIPSSVRAEVVPHKLGSGCVLEESLGRSCDASV